MIIFSDATYTFICPENKVLEYGLGSKLAELRRRFPGHDFQERIISSMIWDKDNNMSVEFDRPFCSC